jgi:hypothetical protein
LLDEYLADLFLNQEHTPEFMEWLDRAKAKRDKAFAQFEFNTNL